MVCIDDSLVLFSKSWQDYKCNIYKISKKPGTYELKPTSTIYINGLVTGATLNDDNSKLALVGYYHYVPFVYVINHFEPNNINTDKALRRGFPRLTGYQTEGIAFVSDNELLISSEYNKVRRGILMKVKIK